MGRATPPKMNSNELRISSIADVLFLTELEKKNSTKVDFSLIKKLYSDGELYLAEVNREKLDSSLFEMYEDDIQLWEPMTDRAIPPMHSISRIAIRVTDDCFWSQSIFDQMEESYTLE